MLNGTLESPRLTMTSGTGRNRGNPVAGAMLLNQQRHSRKEEHTMKNLLYLNGKHITQKAAALQIGVAYLERLIHAATAQFWDDPLVENDFMVPGGILTIRFE
jgi:hypothetical protein